MIIIGITQAVICLQYLHANYCIIQYLVKKCKMLTKFKHKKDVLISSRELDALFLAHTSTFPVEYCFLVLCLTGYHNRETAWPHHLSTTVNMEPFDITLNAFAKQYLSKLRAHHYLCRDERQPGKL